MWRHIAVAWFLTCVGLAQNDAHQDKFDIEHLRPIVQDIVTRRHAIERDDKSTIRALQLDADTLTASLDTAALDKTGRIVLLYYRALAWSMINVSKHHASEPMDEAAAHQVLIDLDSVIASGVEAPGWGVKTAEAQYVAGSVAKNQLRENSRGYAYWEACAQSGHAGCLNIMAGARLTGADGQKVDVGQALEYHTRVFETGIQFRCAGSYSARSIAEIIYFTGTPAGTNDELDWMLRAHNLLGQLETRERQRGQCDWYGAEIEEFLYRMSRGTRDNTILSRAMELPGNTPGRKAVLQYLSGTIDPSTFQAATAGEKYPDYCSEYFYATWYAELASESALAQNYFRALSVRERNCTTELFYIGKKFHLAADHTTSAADPPTH